MPEEHVFPGKGLVAVDARDCVASRRREMGQAMAIEVTGTRKGSIALVA